MSISTTFNNIRILPKMLFSLTLGALSAFIFWKQNASLELNIMLGWDVFAISMLTIYWITFNTTPTDALKKESIIQDPGRIAVFIITMVAMLVAIGIVLLLFFDKQSEKHHFAAKLIIGFTGLVLTWVLVHTVFAMRYAHLYYAPNDDDVGDDFDDSDVVGGLTFPDTNHPNYLDFAYFSFVNGMTFQVSDVSITTTRLRMLVLFQCLLSFAFNTIIVALSINLIASFMA